MLTWLWPLAWVTALAAWATAAADYLAALVPPQPQQQQLTVRPKPHRQWVTPSRHMRPFGINVHGSIVQTRRNFAR